MGHCVGEGYVADDEDDHGDDACRPHDDADQRRQEQQLAANLVAFSRCVW